MSTSTDKTADSKARAKAFFRPQRTRMSLSNFFMSPFALGSLGFAAIAWIVAFAGSIAAASAHSGISFPKFTWWGLVFQLLLFALIIALYATNTFRFHRSFLVGTIAIAFLYTSNSTTQLIYSNTSSRLAAAAGCLLLSVVNLIWLFYYGSEPSSPIIQWIDGGRTDDIDNTNLPTSRSHYREDPLALRHSSLRSTATAHANNPFEAETPELQQQQSHYGAPIKGFENASSSQLTNAEVAIRTSGVETDDDYPYLVRGLYDYVANPDDLNELSFKKGEVFKVKDTIGKWWQGKNSNGDIGMCPSNYIELLA
ncbi:unnamed protein product [Kuraishia capsulata CBS 1993]|uniref:High osmolarity signaling protein SHO1 n=1 Tax=Kuraishia capsulata CBS 1993 TaxID=1382522 RepID=W6MMK9_9ASCO|nr:uncharacterized protein KUCA_T00003813001 [Kuraishia capsulata CBS 1993]CDK27834.1 unnamed protein product [Kuraishia capsulata CBS 1993]